MKHARRLWFSLLGVVLLAPLVARGQQINLTVGSIPALATRMVAVVDGGGIPGSLRASQDLPPGAGSSSLALGVPVGGPYRIRVIAFVAGNVFPAVLRSGKTTGVMVGSGATASASVTLADVSFSTDLSTPTSANSGANVTIKINITDPGDFLDGVSFGELWSGASPPMQNLTGTPASGALESLGNGAYRFTTTAAIPAAGVVYYYQFDASAFAFDNPDGTEAPLLLWPNLPAGGTPPQIKVSSASGVNLTVTNIPANATRLVAVLDGGTGTATLRMSQDVSPGIGSSTLSIGAPPGGPYRIRVISYVSGSRTPAILRTGKTGVSVASSGSTNASVNLADVSGAVDSSTPPSAGAGQMLTIKINLSDPGDFLEGAIANLSVWSSPPSQNFSVNQPGGDLVSSGGGVYQFTAAHLYASEGTLYYQFGGNSFAFNNPDSGQESPYLFSPNLETGAQAFQITVLSSASVFISIGNIPSSATGLVAVVDGGAIFGSLLANQPVSPGVGSSTMSVALPLGGPYRIRVVAHSYQFVLRSGKTSGISVASGGTNNASVVLSDVSGAVDPSTPASGAAGTSVTIKIDLIDPGDFLDGVLSGRIWSSTYQSNGNLSGTPTPGTLTSPGSGAYQFMAVSNLPTNGGTLYYQFGESAPSFDTNTTADLFLVWPNLEAGAKPAQIVVIGPLGITNLNPPSATVGASAFTLTVSGTGFVGGSAVQWNGSALATTYVSGTQLSASVPAGLIAGPGTASIVVNNPGGAVSNTVAFSINAPTPNILSLSPSSVAAGGPGFTLTVNGAGFILGSTVQWNGSALPTTVLNGSQLTASVAANLIASQGTASVTVVNPGGAPSNTVSLTISASATVVSNLIPNSAQAGSPAFALLVNGSGFVANSAVKWNGTPLSTMFLNATQVSASVPAGLIANPGNASVTVVNPGTAASNAAAFTITLPTPSISALSPATAIAGGSPFSVAVSGSGFVFGAAVLWNGTPVPTNYVSQNQLIGSVADKLIASPGVVAVTITSVGGATSNAASFSVSAPTPTISSLNPNTVAAGGPAFALTVNGSGFLVGSTVVWSGTSLATTFLSGTQLTAVVPATLIANSGTAGVTVINPGPVVSNSITFTIAQGLAIGTGSPLPSGTVGVQYSQKLTATGGMTPYTSWTVANGSLPPGITLTTANGAGLLNGVPTSQGAYAFAARVTDSSNATATKQFNISINVSAITISSGGILNAASYAGGTVAPGEIVVIYGSGLGPDTLTTAQLDSRGFVATSLAGTQVMFDGVAAPIIYTQAANVSVVVPYVVSGKVSTQVQVIYQGQGSNIVSMPVAAEIPGIFTADSSGHGQGSIVNQDGTVNAASNPALVGSYVSIYATGEGQTDPAGVDGKPGESPTPVPVAEPVTATIGGLPALVQYAGGAPGSVAGAFQVNVQVPQGVAAGSSIPIVIRVAGQASQPNVTLAIR